ncbi:MAG: Nif3-like dinuclear metal center hexameric protein [Sarcina sp.]
MKIEKFIEIAEKIAPPSLKEDFDNVGLMVGNKLSDVKKILLALDCTNDVIEEAKELGVNLIYTHHPLIFKKPSSITTDTLLGKKIITLIQNDISVYSAHTNLDSVKDGINDTIVHMLGFKSYQIIDKNKFDENAGIGRMVSLDSPIYLRDIIEKCKLVFNIDRLRYVGNLDKKIETIAIVNGSGQSYFEVAYKNGADLVITGDTTYHFVSDYEELGISILDIGHFKSEWPVFLKVSKKLESEIHLSSPEIEFIESKIARDPYNFI